MKKIAIYCGAALGNDPVYQDATIKLADYLVDQQLELVYGGGGLGLMGLLAKRVLAAGGQVHGVMPRELVDRGAALEQLSDLQIVDNMSVRKQIMMDSADGCLALPGGPGTLEEISEAFSWSRLGDYTKPCVLYNVAGYYNPLKLMYKQMVTKGFLTQADFDKLLFSDSLDEILTFMQSYTPLKIRTYNK